MKKNKTFGMAMLGGTVGALVLVGVAMSQPPVDEPTPTPIVTEEPRPAEVPLPEELPLCPTEDSVDCYWDADKQGNQLGTDVVNPPEPAPVDPEAPVAPVEMPYEGQWDEIPDGTLICGEGAKPAIDYNEVWGWWAYCEPALVD